MLGMELWSKDSFVFMIFTSAPGGPVSLLSGWNWGTKWPERETDNLPLRSAYMTGKIIFIRAYFATILRCVELI